MVDITKEDSDEEDESAVLSRSTRSGRIRGQPQRSRSSSTRPASSERDLLLSQSRTFRDFENLFVALDALEQWRDLADQANK